MIEITTTPISPEHVVNQTRTLDSGCVATYVGLIRNTNLDKPVEYVEYSDEGNKAAERLESIVAEAQERWPLNDMSIVHRIGRLNVGDINLVIAVAAGHRGEALEACGFAVDEFKARLPTQKVECYLDGTTNSAF